MTEQEEAVGRQRLGELEKHQASLVRLETDRDVIFPPGHKRHGEAVQAYNDEAPIVTSLEADPSIKAVRILDAEKRLAEAQKTLATHQTAVDKATTEVTEAQSALDALKT